MQFNSFIFIMLFLPVTVCLYFLLNKITYLSGKLVIIISSIIFYVYIDLSTFIVLGISLIFNYLVANFFHNVKRKHKILCLFPIVMNVGLLFYFKYSNFVIKNLSNYLGKDFVLKELILPIGISFFTFQQIAYIVAVYREEIKQINVIDYLSYILYFPKILMGPLIEPVDFIKQYNDVENKKIKWDNIACGIKLFSFGLFKKVILADTFAGAVSWGYSNVEVATSVDWIFIMLFYTFEIYFDFSGYSDMAVGTSLMFNIELPINFDSPYKAMSIRDFWKRWHISLTNFFTKYIYIPLGGNKRGKILTYINTVIVFLVSGIWHGANWTFILWGLIYGILMVVERIFYSIQKNIFEPVKWGITFGIVNILWVLFRADSITQWKNILKKILFLEDTTISSELIEKFDITEKMFLTNILHIEYFTENIQVFWMIFFVLLALGICLLPKNNYRNMKEMSLSSMLLAALAFIWGFISLSGETVFVYFNF